MYQSSGERGGGAGSKEKKGDITDAVRPII